MKTYDAIKDLSAKLSMDNAHLVSDHQICWSSVNEICLSISSDLESVFRKKNFVTAIRFILNDPHYRQSASCCIMEVKFAEDDEFILSAECVIDHNRVMVKVLMEPSNHEMNFIADEIKAKYNSEFLSDLKDLAE